MHKKINLGPNPVLELKLKSAEPKYEKLDSTIHNDIDTFFGQSNAIEKYDALLFDALNSTLLGRCIKLGLIPHSELLNVVI